MVHPLITLYPPTETEFNTNGLGSLGEAASCVVTEEGNGSFELEMVYPVSGRRYKDLVNRSIIFAKPNPVDPPQPFRIYEISRPMKGLVTFFAAHVSYDLSGYPIRPFKAGSASGAMSGLKTNSVESHPFSFWTDKNVVSDFDVITPIPTRSALGGVQGSILDIYGGEYKFDRFLVRLYTHRGYDRGVVIRYGKNLTDLKQEENCSRVYTGVLPYWYQEEEDKKTLIQLPESIVPTNGSYNFVNIYTLDLSSEFQEPPTESQLRERTKKYIKDNNLGVPNVSLTVSFAQLEQTKEYEHLSLLERVELFDTIHVEFPEMNVSSKAKVCQTVFDVLSGRYSSVTIGEIRASISDTVINQDERLTQEMNSTKSELRKAVDRATNWITNGKGYMVAVKDEAGNWMEICSLDTPNIDTAVNVWRWNNGGFGFSSHGYNGPFETAITQGGEIVADFITTGTLTASLIRAGILQSLDGETFYLDLEAGVLKMNATELAIKGKTVEQISADEATEKLETFFVNEYAPTIEKLKDQSDKKSQNWYQEVDPSEEWFYIQDSSGNTINDSNGNKVEVSNISEIKKEHVSDLWYNTNDQKIYYWDGSRWKLTTTDVPDELFDVIDGKSSTFISQPTTPYYVGDTWFNSDSSDIMTCIKARETGSFVLSDWQKRNKYIDKNTAKTEAQSAVDAQTQDDIFNKLTNNGKTQGIYIQNGLVYINASYIKTGIITDGKGNNTWDLVNGTLVAKNIRAYGYFQSGQPTDTFYIEISFTGQIRGYRNGNQVGYIDYSSDTWLTSEQKRAYGLKMQAEGIIEIYSPVISTADTADTHVTSNICVTTTVYQPLISGITAYSDGRISWTYGTFSLTFINGLLTTYGTVGT